MATATTFTVAPEEAGARLDKLLGTRLGLSRREVAALLEDGKVRLDEQPAALRHKGLLLRPGQRLAVAAFARRAEAMIRPNPEMPLTLLAQGEGVIVVDKPAGVPVFPHRPGETGTLLNAVVARYPALQGVGEGGLGSGVVHRLDQGTSGALAVALTSAAWERWRAAFAARRVQKSYRAIVAGRLGGGARETPWLYVAQHRPAKVRVAPPSRPDARPTALEWRALETFDAATLLEVELESGFLHQIRATFAALGHPILGDARYGAPAEPAAPRQMLHAARLALEGLEAMSPDPPDFAAVLGALRRRG